MPQQLIPQDLSRPRRDYCTDAERLSELRDRRLFESAQEGILIVGALLVLFVWNKMNLPLPG